MIPLEIIIPKSTKKSKDKLFEKFIPTIAQSWFFVTKKQGLIHIESSSSLKKNDFAFSASKFLQSSYEMASIIWINIFISSSHLLPPIIINYLISAVKIPTVQIARSNLSSSDEINVFSPFVSWFIFSQLWKGKLRRI